MEKKITERLEKLTHDELERRFQELRKKLGLANPKPLDCGSAPESSLDEFEEYEALKKKLGY